MNPDVLLELIDSGELDLDVYNLKLPEYTEADLAQLFALAQDAATGPAGAQCRITRFSPPASTGSRMHLTFDQIADSGEEQLLSALDLLEGSVRLRNTQHYHHQKHRDQLARLAELDLMYRSTLYVTPGRSRPALGPHFDREYGVIHQLHGSKQWYFHAGYDPHTISMSELLDIEARLAHLDERALASEPWEERTLTEGAVMFLPPGLIHFARATCGLSVHLNYAVFPRCDPEGYFMSRFHDVLTSLLPAAALLDLAPEEVDNFRRELVLALSQPPVDKLGEDFKRWNRDRNEQRRHTLR